MLAASQSLRALLQSLPLDEAQQAQAAELVRQCTTDELKDLGLAAPPRPFVPKQSELAKLSMPQRLAAVQKVMNSIQYNHQPGYMYNVSKDRPFNRIMDTAREVLREALPIKCIEAVFLGTLLTAGWEGLHRIPLGFKSKVNGETYRHVVLILHHAPMQKWGALGISRREELMFKELSYNSLSALVADFKAGYEKWFHKLTKARVGLPFHHDMQSSDPVCWRYCSISPCKQSWATCAALLDKYAAEYTRAYAKFNVLGHLPTRGGAPQESLQSPSGKASVSSVSPAAAPKMSGASQGKRRPQLAAAASGTGRATVANATGHVAESLGEDVDENAAKLASGSATTSASGDVPRTVEKRGMGGGNVEDMMPGPSSDQSHSDDGASLSHPSGGKRVGASPIEAGSRISQFVADSDQDRREGGGSGSHKSVQLVSLHANDCLVEDDDSQDEDSDDNDYDS